MLPDTLTYIHCLPKLLNISAKRTSRILLLINTISNQASKRSTPVTIGWKPRGACTQPKGEYNDEKDVLFFADAPDMHFQLRDGQFAIFFPEDVHAPMIGEDEIRKLVIKVKK